MTLRKETLESRGESYQFVAAIESAEAYEDLIDVLAGLEM